MSFEGSSNANPGVARPERRVPRYEFVATIELNDSASAMRFSGRVTEISRYGCYVDILNPLPLGSPVTLRISREPTAFATQGKVIYVQEPIGIGIGFVDPPADQLKILDAWLAELA